MNRLIAWVMLSVLFTMLAGCSAAAKKISAESRSKRARTKAIISWWRV